MLTGGSITITKKRGLKNWAVIDTLMLLLAKACKTLRAIRAAALEGCGQDAAILLRALFETATAILWILQRDTRRRVLLFVAHGDQRLLVMAEEQLKTPGLKRGRKRQVAAAQAKVDEWRSLLSATDLSSTRRHWSGLGSLENAVKQIKGWRLAYNTVYRATSSYAHGSDAIRHAIFEDGRRPVFKILPGDDEVERTVTVAGVLMYTIVSRLNSRMGLGLDAKLEGVEPEGLRRNKTDAMPPSSPLSG